MDEALRTFAESVNLKQFMRHGKVDWEKVERHLSELVNSAVETVAGAVRQRYLNDDGSLDPELCRASLGPHVAKLWLQSRETWNRWK
eukprot:Skav210313  [mRNA]  locus=scaffold475:258859:259453:- [translate_table: standard]